MVTKFGRALLIVAAAAACTDSPAPAGPGEHLAPLIEPTGSLALQAVPNEYIVVLRDGVGAAGQNDAVATVVAEGGTITARWDQALNGFAARLSPQALTELRRRTDIRFIESDTRTYAVGVQSPVGSWGQDRVDQRNLPLDNSYTYPNTASNVDAYILDTGLNATHTEFTGRVGNGVNYAGGTGGTNDCNGHGTHVAGTVAGTVYGIAKGATVHAVRVLDCAGSGQWSWFISGINWVIANKPSGKQWVANASLGGGINSSADAAADNLVASGVTFAVASGNSNASACNSSPARRGVTNGLISTNSSTNTDARSSFSNFGTCTDIFAPGSSIKSAWIGSNSATSTISGTSMASPHVAGVAALYLGANAAMTPAQVEAQMKTDATPNKITNPGVGSPNLLVYTGNIGGGTPPPPNLNPIAAFTHTCTLRPNGEFKCTFDGSTSSDPDGTISAYLWTSPGLPSRTGSTATWGLHTGTYSVTLQVTDNLGATNSLTKSISVGSAPPPNQPPVADFTHNCVLRPNGEYRCDFDGTSSMDTDGTIAAYSWTSPGLPTRTGATARWGLHAGTHVVTLTVTDDDGAIGTKVVSVVLP
ncbi:MAG: S8 family serine peptidase [Gemmatimonadota bacterium]